MNRRLLWLTLSALALAPLAILVGRQAHAAQLDTVRFGSNMHDSFQKINGEPLHRATLTPDNTTAESNLTANGGTAVTYTFFGGERVCVQALTTDAYVEVIIAASMSAAGAKGVYVSANQPLSANCFTLLPGSTSVSSLCTAAGPCLVKLFEMR